MTDKFEDLCHNVLKLRDHKVVLIRKTVLQCLPNLAKFNTGVFIEKFLKISLETLLVANEKERDIAFLAIGELAVIVGGRMAVYSTPIINSLLSILRIKQRGVRSAYFPELYTCISLMAKGLGPNLGLELRAIASAPHFHLLLFLLFLLFYINI